MFPPWRATLLEPNVEGPVLFMGMGRCRPDQGGVRHDANASKRMLLVNAS